MRKKKKNEIIKVEKMNELHTESKINTVKEELYIKDNKLTENKNISRSSNNIINNTILEENNTKNNKDEKEKIKELNKNNKDEKEKIKELKKNNEKIIILKKKKIKNIEKENYNKLLYYLLENKKKVIDMLYKKKILKNKCVPIKILINLFVNYINNDIEIILL